MERTALRRLLIQPLEVLNNIQGIVFFVGAYPCGRWAWHTPCKPSPTGVGSYKDNKIGVLGTNKGHSNFIGPDQWVLVDEWCQ
jgi:hypothetical protein